MEYVHVGSECDYYVKIYDETGCPVLSMPAFTIFIDQWPWIVAYMLVALGAYMLIFGRKHFTRALKLFSALFIVSHPFLKSPNCEALALFVSHITHHLASLP